MPKLTKKNRKQHLSASSPVQITPKMQKIFLALLVFNWVGTLLAPLISMATTGVKINGNFYAYMFMQSLLPLMYLFIAVPFVWRHYAGTLKRWFMAGFIGLIGIISYGAFVQIENAIRNQWFPPSQSAGNSSVWSLYSHDITLMCLGLAIYVAIIGLWDMRLGRQK